jgi:hypothetical protein
MTLAEAFDCDVIKAKEKLLKEESFILGPQVVFNRAVVPTSPASSNSDSSSSDEKIEPLPPQVDVEPLKEATGKNVIFFRL